MKMSEQNLYKALGSNFYTFVCLVRKKLSKIRKNRNCKFEPEQRKEDATGFLLGDLSAQPIPLFRAQQILFIFATTKFLLFLESYTFPGLKIFKFYFSILVRDSADLISVASKLNNFTIIRSGLFITVL